MKTEKDSIISMLSHFNDEQILELISKPPKQKELILFQNAVKEAAKRRLISSEEAEKLLSGNYTDMSFFKDKISPNNKGKEKSMVKIGFTIIGLSVVIFILMYFRRTTRWTNLNYNIWWFLFDYIWALLFFLAGLAFIIYGLFNKIFKKTGKN